MYELSFEAYENFWTLHPDNLTLQHLPKIIRISTNLSMELDFYNI